MTPASAAPAGPRREAIVASLDEFGSVRSAELSERFDVTQATIRNDLELLQQARTLIRVHGGAIAVPRARHEDRFEVARPENLAAKRTIAKNCADLIMRGHTVLLDVGTTVNEIAHIIAARDDLSDVTVVTNSLSIVSALEDAPHVEVIMTGGTVRRLQHSLVNPLAGLVLQRIHADIAFIGCNGIHREAGITNSNLAEAEMKQSMIAAARRVVVAADSRKLGAVSFAEVCPVTVPNSIITDDAADPAVVAQLAEAGAAVALVPTPPPTRGACSA